MARVLLVSFPGYPYTPSSLLPDNGLASLAGTLIASGHEPKVLDYATVSTIRRLYPEWLSRRVRPLAVRMFVERRKLSAPQKAAFVLHGHLLDAIQSKRLREIAEEVAAEAASYRADFVGLKLWNGDGFLGSVMIAEAVRARLPEARIIGGGPHVDYFNRHILDYFPVFDVLVQGEGERVLPELIAAMEANRDWRAIPGVIWREGSRISANPPRPLDNLDDLPLPVYDREVYPAIRGDEKIRIGVVDESRGCPNRCAFCIHPIKSGGKWCLKTPGRVVEEMNRLASAIRTRYFVYSGSNTSARIAVGIADEILRSGMDVRYGCFGHVQGIARADFDVLKQSGCEAIFYGLESGSRRILEQAFNKPLDLDLAERVIRHTMDAGIAAITSIIYPAPFEDPCSRAETFEYLIRLRPDSVPVTIPGLIPGTRWDTDALRYGFEKSRRRDFWRYALSYKIKLLYPPSLWKPLPYHLNGKTSRQLMRECAEFVDALEHEGILTHVPHEMVLMAAASGRRRDLKGFRDLSRALFLSGDADGIADLVAKINRNVQPLTTGCCQQAPTGPSAGTRSEESGSLSGEGQGCRTTAR